MATNKFYPSIPESTDPQMRQIVRQIWDRLNFVLDEVEKIKTTPSQALGSVQSQVSRLNVAIQAVQDSLTQQNTFVSFGSATPIEGFSETWPGSTYVTTLGVISQGTWNGSIINPAWGGTGVNSSGETGFAWVNSGSWDFVTPTQVTSQLDVFTETLKGLVPSPGTIANKFLRDDGTWQTISVGAAGSTGQVQFNSSGQFAASSKLTFDDTAQALKLVRELRLYRTPTTPVYAGIRVADLLDENVMLTLPTGLGEYGQYLTTDGFGGLFWGTYTPVAANTKPYAWFIS